MRSTIEHVLNEMDIRHEVLRDLPHQIVFCFGLSINNGRSDFVVDIRPQNKQVLLYGVFPNKTPENKRMRIAEFIARANYGLLIGNFELDFNDGELRFKNAYLFDTDSSFSLENFKRNLVLVFAMMDKYYPGIMAVMYGNLLPEHAIDQIENNASPGLN